MVTTIPYNDTEVVNVQFPYQNVTPYLIVAWKRYSLNFNATIGAGKVFRLRWYQPSTSAAGGNGLSPLYVILNGEQYELLNLPQIIFITIAKRGGGYYCIDAPLSTFAVTSAGSIGHYEKELANWEIDTTNSYVRASQNVLITNPYPFILQLFFSVRPQP